MGWTVNGNSDPNQPIADFQEIILPVSVTDDVITGTVTDGWATQLAYADQAFQAALQFIQNLEQAVLSTTVPAVDTNLAKIALDISNFNYLIGIAPPNPGNTFTFAEVPYSSTLLTDLRARLLEWVDGKSTGLLPSVEQAIWDRGRAREVVASNRKAKEAVRSFAMRGFSKPPGALSLEIQDAVQAQQDTTNTLSRDVMIKQAELEQTNRRFSFEQAGKMEEALISYTSQQATRLLESAKAFQQYVIDIYQHEVAAYGVEAQVYSARVGAETAAFKAEVDMQVAEANVRMEAARIELQTWVSRLQIQADAVKAGAQVAAQLAAASLSAVSMHGSLGANVSNSAQNSTSQQGSIADHRQTSLGVNYNYSGSA